MRLAQIIVNPAQQGTGPDFGDGRSRLSGLYLCRFWQGGVVLETGINPIDMAVEVEAISHSSGLTIVQV